MLIKCHDKVINLDKYDRVYIEESFTSYLNHSHDRWIVKAERVEASTGFFGGKLYITEEITEFKNRGDARKFVSIITSEWVKGERKLFNVEDWVSKIC